MSKLSEMNSSLRLLLLGGTDLSLEIAKHLLRQQYGLAGVVHVPAEFGISYSRTSVPNIRYADISAWCEENGIRSLAYDSMDQLVEFAEEIGADFALVAGWYHMLPRRVREIFRFGCAGVHASLLPELRGGAPLNWAILSGKTRTGVTMFALGDGIDDGRVYAQRSFPIEKRAYIGDLVSLSRAKTLEMLDDVLPEIASGNVILESQKGAASYCLQRVPQDGRVDWRMPLHAVDRLIRATGKPYAGAYGLLNGDVVRIWRATPLDGKIEIYGEPGQIACIPEFDQPCIMCGDGAVLVDCATGEDGRDARPKLRGAGNQRFDIA